MGDLHSPDEAGSSKVFSMWCVVEDTGGLAYTVHGPYDTEDEAKAKLGELEGEIEASEDEDDDVEADDLDFFVIEMEKE